MDVRPVKDLITDGAIEISAARETTNEKDSGYIWVKDFIKHYFMIDSISRCNDVSELPPSLKKLIFTSMRLCPNCNTSEKQLAMRLSRAVEG